MNATDWLNAYKKAWETGDANAAAGLFTANAEYRETPFDTPMRGQEEIKRYWAEVPKTQNDIRFTFTVLLDRGNTCIAQWTARFTRIPSNTRVELDGIFVLTFDRSGLCTSLQEWWHRKESEPM